MLAQTVFQTVVIMVGAVGAASLALLYFQRVKFERPAIGTFNTRDLIVVFGFVVALPALYLFLASEVVMGLLLLTFASALSITLRPVIRSAIRRRVLIATLLISNVIVTYTLLGTAFGLALYWVLTSTVVMVAAVGISNLYIQGGLDLRQVAWFAVALAVYDAFFVFVVPWTPQLAFAFTGRPLHPAVGLAFGGLAANIGLGDLLVFGLFTTAAYKSFGRRGARAALITVVIVGGLLPALTRLVTSLVVGDVEVGIPVQVLFGPAALVVASHLRSPRRDSEASAPADNLSASLVGAQP